MVVTFFFWMNGILLATEHLTCFVNKPDRRRYKHCCLAVSKNDIFTETPWWNPRIKWVTVLYGCEFCCTNFNDRELGLSGKLQFIPRVILQKKDQCDESASFNEEIISRNTIRLSLCKVLQRKKNALGIESLVFASWTFQIGINLACS